MNGFATAPPGIRFIIGVSTCNNKKNSPVFTKSVSKPETQRSNKQKKPKTASFDEKHLFHLQFSISVYENNSELKSTEQNCTFFMQSKITNSSVALKSHSYLPQMWTCWLHVIKARNSAVALSQIPLSTLQKIELNKAKYNFLHLGEHNPILPTGCRTGFYIQRQNNISKMFFSA